VYTRVYTAVLHVRYDLLVLESVFIEQEAAKRTGRAVRACVSIETIPRDTTRLTRIAATMAPASPLAGAVLLHLCIAGATASRPLVKLDGLNLRTHQLLHPIVVDDRGAARALGGAHHTRVPGTATEHARRSRLQLTAFGRAYDVVLHRSDDLTSGSYTRTRHTANGSVAHTKRHEIDHCYYHGKVSGQPGSIVTAYTCEGGVEASIRTEDGEHLLLLPSSRVVELQGSAPPGHLVAVDCPKNRRHKQAVPVDEVETVVSGDRFIAL
jgi:hypothetical protein